MEAKKILIEPVKKNEGKAEKLRVAAYCRVSTDTEDQQTSFEGQVKHYTELIEAKPDWELAGIYADDGITGTSAEKRPEFMRLIADCEAHKIDLVICKSLSRWGRNTLETLTYVRRLKDLGVNLIFEINNIDTRATYSEMLLTVLAAFAQEESRSISENTSWGIRRRFEEGVTRWSRLYGYEKTEEGEYQIVPEQAAVVRKIFDLYEHGESLQGICNYLKAYGIKSPTGEAKWTTSSVHTLLGNERYTGDIILQKFVTENHLSHKSRKNRSSSSNVPSFFVEGHHTPIITRKQYDRCQTIMKMRRLTGKGKDVRLANQYPLADKLRCPYCGSVLFQHSIPVQANHKAGWCCETGEEACHGFIIRSNLVEEALLEAYSKLDADKVAGKLESPRFGEAAKLALEIKKGNPFFERVDFWWVDDLVDHIEFGAHSKSAMDFRRAAALGKKISDDRTMKVFWKCGLITTVMSGVNTDRDHPARIAELYNLHLERQQKKAQQKKAQEETEE